MASKVLIVGCGALGSPIAAYLAGAGIGNITVADFDNVEMSNLHRQVFYSERSIGESKAEWLKATVASLNSEIKVNAHVGLVDKRFLETHAGDYDLIVDAADNPSTTYMLDEFCHKQGLHMSTAGVSEWRAQVFSYIPGSVRYSEIIPPPEEGCGILPCSMAGIVGPVACFAASLQSVEVIKMILGVISESGSRLITANLLKGEINVMRL